MNNRIVLKLVGFMFLMVVFITCDNQENIIREYPNITTTSVNNVSELGATFNAGLSNESKSSIVEYGFVWSENSIPTVDNSDKIILPKATLKNQFSARITTTLKKSTSYNVRAYVRSEEYLVYGKSISFFSLGSDSPILNGFVPKTGVWGDTIVIKGAHFSYVENNNKVFFKDLASSVINSTDSTITCLVPDGLADKEVPISIEIASQRIDSRDSFTMKSAIVSSASNLTGTFRDEITVNGDNFGVGIERNKVYFGSKEAPITYADRNVLKFIVPDDLESSSEEIKIVSNLQEPVLLGAFKLLPPKILSIPNGFYLDNELTISGEFFHPILSKNKVTIEGIGTNIVSNNLNNYILKVPKGPFTKRKVRFKIQVLDLITEFESDINILDKWVLVDENLPFRYYVSFHSAAVANGIAYIIAPAKDIFDNKFYLWKFNPTDYTWEQEDLPFPLPASTSLGVLESDGDNLYTYLPGIADNFWKYDVVNSVWTKKSNFIGGQRSGATHFSINGKIYIGLGVDFEPYIRVPKNDLYRYDPTSDNWVQVSSVPFGIYDSNGRIYTTTFVIGNTGYFTGGALSTGDVSTWSYNALSDNWTRVVDNPYHFQSGDAGFALNGFGYMTCAGYSSVETWKYDPNVDEWQQMEDVGKVQRGSHFAFLINGKAYTGGGRINGGGSTGYDMYEFIP